MVKSAMLSALQIGHDLVFAEDLAAGAVHDIGGEHARELLPVLCFYRGPEDAFILLRAGCALEGGRFLFAVDGAAGKTNSQAAASRLVIQIVRIAPHWSTKKAAIVGSLSVLVLLRNA